MTADPYGRGPVQFAMPPFLKGARIVLGILWAGFLILTVSSFWLRQTWPGYTPLDPVEATLGLQPWRFVSYVLVNDPIGLIISSLFFWMFSGDVEARWGTPAFLRFCAWMIAGGAAGSLMVIPITLFAPQGSPLATLCGPTGGFSPVFFGVVVAWGLIYPDRRLLFPPVAGRWLVWIGLGIDGLLVFAGRETLTGLFVTVGAAGLAWVLVRGKWRLSAWRKAKPKPVRRARSGGHLRAIRGGAGRVERGGDDDDDDDDGLPPKPKYLN